VTKRTDTLWHGTYSVKIAASEPTATLPFAGIRRSPDMVFVRKEVGICLEDFPRQKMILIKSNKKTSLMDYML
jgi:hypothetical protein